ncbi:MAG: phosphotransferase, partial [Pseudomonadota bacterium]
TTLGALQSLPLPQNLPDYVPQMANLAALSLDWYAPECADLRGDLVAAIEDLLPLALRKTAVFVHRDFHGENLIWLPERTETKQIGLLDFQDAMSGPAEYDIGSLIHDPRRTVSDGAKAAAWQAYLDRAGHCETDARLGLAICSAQRSLRILGVFARLCMRDGKAHYPDFIPRTWQALQRDLSHPALARLAGVLTTLPAPTDDRLAAIKSQAGQLRGHSQARVWA